MNLLSLFHAKPIAFGATDFVVKNDAGKARFNLIFISIPILLVIAYRWKTMKEMPLIEVLFIAILFGSIITFFLIKAVDRRPKLIATETGIWMRKTGFLSWGQIWIFDVLDSEIEGENGLYLYFRLKESGKEYKIKITDVDQSKTDIAAAILKISKGNIIQGDLTIL